VTQRELDGYWSESALVGYKRWLSFAATLQAHIEDASGDPPFEPAADP